MTIAPTFWLAGLLFVVRLAVGSISVPLRQSFIMGVSEERSRGAVAAFGNLPSSVTSSFAPSLSAYLVEAAGISSPLLVAAAAQLANAAAYYRAFRGMRPPEEAARTAAGAPTEG
jgi:sugar phosphate permease